MSQFELLSVLVALLSAVIAFISLYRTREVTRRQIELQERQVVLERESAKLAKLQREQIEAGSGFPTLNTNMFPVKIYYSDGTLEDVAVELVLENNSSLNRSINNCSVGLLDKEDDKYPTWARQAEFREKLAEYPITIPPNSSVILYSFERRLKELYKKDSGPTTPDDRKVAVVISMAGITAPLTRVIGRYSPTHGLRPL